MRANISVLLSITLLAGACFDADCLPEPEHDASRPQVRVVVEYSSPSGTRLRSEHVLGDSSTTLAADRRQPVILFFSASDASGLRSLSPSITIQQTVGIGVERSYVDVDPVTATCPRHELSYRHEIRSTGTGRSFLVTVVAENWVGLASTLELLTLRAQ